MGKRLGIAGYQNSGKSYTRRYIPDGENVVIIQPSSKAPYLYKGPANANKLSPAELDLAIKEGRRTMVPDFDLVSPEGKFGSIKEAIHHFVTNTKNASPNTNEFDIMDSLVKYKKPGYFKPEHLKGNVIYAPQFQDLVSATKFVDKLCPWVHTLILPDFTHFITDRITSDDFLNQKYGGQVFERYLELAAASFKGYIRSSDILRKDLIVVTEYHVEENKEQGCYELFVPGGKMVKEKFLPSSYYDFFLFTDVKFDELDEEQPPEYRYVTRKTKRYPEARSGGLYDSLYVPNNVQDALTKLRAHANIPIMS